MPLRVLQVANVSQTDRPVAAPFHTDPLGEGGDVLKAGGGGEGQRSSGGDRKEERNGSDIYRRAEVVHRVSPSGVGHDPAWPRSALSVQRILQSSGTKPAGQQNILPDQRQMVEKLMHF
jgi:hypothetical protein